MFSVRLSFHRRPAGRGHPPLWDARRLPHARHIRNTRLNANYDQAHVEKAENAKIRVYHFRFETLKACPI